jgi:ribosomal protein L22
MVMLTDQMMMKAILDNLRQSPKWAELADRMLTKTQNQEALERALKPRSRRERPIRAQSVSGTRYYE